MRPRQCTASPTIKPVGPLLHVECKCGLDYYVPRVGVNR